MKVDKEPTTQEIRSKSPENDFRINKTIYDQDYYAQSEGQYRLHKSFQPLLSLLYFCKVWATLAKLNYPSVSKRRALDVGAGRGEFLYYISKKGWEVTGTQISKSAIIAAKRFYNLNLLETELPLSSELGTFDLITYWHVFEHLENPKEHLCESRNLLKDENSILIIEVPNPQSLGAQICYNTWIGSDKQHHINMLSQSEILQMIQVANLRVIRIDGFSFKFTLLYLYSALCGWFSRGFLDFDFFMALLKEPVITFCSNIAKIFLLVLISPFSFMLSILLIPIGIWLKRPEILRIYAKQAIDEDQPLGNRIS